ncbi:shikimate kinase [Gammaproteobacteria bacterium]|nr:shikimate kinase [Gammaproteobacteria bacterium]
MNIFLIGMMGSGKTSVGQLLSKYLNTTFYDLDAGIEKRFNLTIKEIFNEYGEKKFREVESSMLQETNNLENSIISTGGGIVIENSNREFLKGQRVYFLNNSIKILYKRATKKREQRPLLKDITLNEFSTIYDNRMNLYQECANITLNAKNKSIYEIVEEISNHEKFSF